MKHIPASAIRTAAYPIVIGENTDHELALFRTTKLFGLSLQDGSPKETAAHIVRGAAHGRRTTVNFINAHCVNVAMADRDYRNALERSDLLLPDGVGVQIAARLAGCEVPENVNGTDLFPLICERAAIEGAGIFMLGGMPGIADAAAAWACGEWPSLRIRGTHSGYFAAEEEEALIERINRSGAAILCVGLGVPLQELWISRNRDRLNIPVVIGVGGLFDYYSGRIARAPAAIRAMRCEWVWRLAMEPRRLGRRYFLGNPIFIAHAIAEAAERRGLTKFFAGAAKRTFDILVAASALLALLPMFLIVAIAIRAEDRGPVFFRQRRIGKDGRAFAMMKFRSMYTDAEDRRKALLAQSDRSGTCFKMKDDPRITRTGKFLRRFSIDELPQLINVLSGTMSIVGPRPALPSEVARYEGRQWERLHGKPGITCSWQVKGRAEIPFHRQAIMDRAYLRRRSFTRDLKLVLMTLPAIVNGRGAY
ncbi:WecB/TagA/CpsF family glycosyltransferase [Qipengyuania aquimaris]|uniref:WecB/TagA/CpsF family glycosyltransferase n=1 Tax=Qipengyuania aquimaris TaxID=255984 RepID=UPI001C98209F|nr:WecB/TagA/CpsF family glycosyltransferase [Qipengyuania aquimaris]MBY6127756.1 WecB/TagA/CpsF family glycosyltransferase [Qipengyuania aquimaris]